MEKRIALLLQRTGVKRKALRITRRKLKTDPLEEERINGLYFGSVWGIADKSVPFDSKRKSSHIKSSLRPCVVLETPRTFKPYDLVHVAPGTTTPHPIGGNYPPCLKTAPPQEKVKVPTYFLIYYRWFSVQKNLNQRFFVLSDSAQAILNKILASL